jgi:hypothetical protein
MADVASLGIQVDSSTVETARSRLRDFKSEASGSSAAVQQLERTVANLARAQQQTNDILRGHTQQLRDATQQTSSYVDTLAKWATAVGGVYVAYKGLQGAIELHNAAAREQVNIVEKLSSAFSSVALYGRNAFQIMSDGAIGAERNLSILARSIGTTGAQLATIQRSFSTFSATPAQANGALATISGILTGTDAGSIAGRSTLASIGVATSGNPAEIARQVVAQLQRTQSGPQRNAIATQLLGTDAAILANDTAASPLPDSFLSGTNSLRGANAFFERQAANRRAQLDAQLSNNVASTPGISIFSQQQRDRLSQDFTLGLNQILGRADSNPNGIGTGLKTIFQGLGASLLGGGEAGGENPGIIPHPSFFNPESLDSRAAPPTDFAGGFNLLAGAGVTGPLAASNATAQAEELLANQQKLGITSEQLASAFEILARRVEDASDPVAALTRQLSVAQARAGAAINGPREADIAGITAEVGQIPGLTAAQRAGIISARTGLVDASVQQRINSTIFSTDLQSDTRTSQIEAFLSGRGGASALLAGARGRARQIDPDNLDDDLTQSLLRGSALDEGGSAAAQIKRLSALVANSQKETSALNSGDASSFFNLRQDTSIDLTIKSLQEYADALREVGGENDKTAQLMDKLVARAKEQKTAFDAIRPQRAAAQLGFDVRSQVGELNDQANLIAAGASPNDILLARNVDALTKRSQQSGANLDPATIQQWAKATTDAEERVRQLIDTEKEWNGALNSTIEELAKGITGALTHIGQKNFQQFALGILQQIDNALLDALVTKPLENLFKNLIGFNQSGTSTFSFANPGGGNAGSVFNNFSNLFGSGSSGGSTAALDAETASATTGELGFAGGAAGDAAVGAGAAAGGSEVADLALVAAIAHSGGIIGHDFLPGRIASASMFRGAPRYHSGLLPDETPAILQKGEAVLSRNQVANLAANGGAGGVSVSGPLIGTVNINAKDPHSFGKTIGQQAGEALDQLQRVGRRHA